MKASQENKTAIEHIIATAKQKWELMHNDTQPIKAGDVVDIWNTKEMIDKAERELAALYTNLKLAEEKLEKARGIILWALGENGYFPDLPKDWPKRKFYWRKELREQFESVANLKEQP